MSAVKMYPFIVIAGHIKAEACGVCKEYAGFPAIFYNCASCNNIKLWQNAVFKRYGNIRRGVL